MCVWKKEASLCEKIAFYELRQIFWALYLRFGIFPLDVHWLYGSISGVWMISLTFIWVAKLLYC